MNRIRYMAMLAAGKFQKLIDNTRPEEIIKFKEIKNVEHEIWSYGDSLLNEIFH